MQIFKSVAITVGFLVVFILAFFAIGNVLPYMLDAFESVVLN